MLVNKFQNQSPAAIRLFPFLVREVPLEEIDGVRKEKERLTAAWHELTLGSTITHQRSLGRILVLPIKHFPFL